MQTSGTRAEGRKKKRPASLFPSLEASDVRREGDRIRIGGKRTQKIQMTCLERSTTTPGRLSKGQVGLGTIKELGCVRRDFLFIDREQPQRRKTQKQIEDARTGIVD